MLRVSLRFPAPEAVLPVAPPAATEVNVQDRAAGNVSAIEIDVYENFESEVTSGELGEMLLRRLGELDEVAYVRFASVYRDFNDVRDFVNALRPMLDDEKNQKKAKP